MRVGIIGTGNMGATLCKGLANQKSYDIYIHDQNKEKAVELANQTKVTVSDSLKAMLEQTTCMILAVKPNVISVVLEEIKALQSTLSLKDSIFVSIAAGVTLKAMEEILGSDQKIIRAMPNTPALVNEGMTAICGNANLGQTEIEMVKTLFKSVGQVEALDESLFHAFIGISGSSPAYVYMFIEAMADAAVVAGMSRDLAYRCAAQAVAGSGKMVVETNTHPGVLKDQVCSPGGTTIEAVKVLEEEGFRGSVIEGVTACIEKSKQLSKKES